MITEQVMQELIMFENEKLAAVGFEALDLSPTHLLLYILPNETSRMDMEGRPEITICNVEML
jgi:hypothetical protein